MKHLFLTFLVLALAPLAQAGKIQGQGIKTAAECVSAGSTAAACLPKASQIYVDSLSKSLSQAITDGDLSGGGSLSDWTINAVSSTNYVLALTDRMSQSKFLTIASSTATVIEVPPNSSVAFPVGSQINMIELGSAATSLSTGVGVTVNGLNGANSFSGAGAMASLLKIGTNVWQFFGDVVGFIQATGGTVSFLGNQEIHTFTSASDTLYINYVPAGKTISYLLAAGGGAGGGFRTGGGGGAGGCLTATGYALTTGTYPITIGAGGASSASTTGGSGGNSTWNSLTAIGGGGGGRGQGPSGTNGVSGGSGGGGGGEDATVRTGGTGTGGQGNSGSSSSNAGTPGYGSGAGGGAGAAATNGSGTTAGTPGVGIFFTPTSSYYCGGGGGGAGPSGSSSSAGALGGGGDGGAGAAAGNAGAANSGGGGGGTGTTASTSGGDGGSGVLIISFQYQ